jgi:hypothetical protein
MYSERVTIESTRIINTVIYLAMPRDASLSEVEKGRILALKELGKSISFIANSIHRSRCVIRNFLESPDDYVNKNEKDVKNTFKTRRTTDR